MKRPKFMRIMLTPMIYMPDEYDAYQVLKTFDCDIYAYKLKTDNYFVIEKLMKQIKTMRDKRYIYAYKEEKLDGYAQKRRYVDIGLIASTRFTRKLFENYCYPIVDKNEYIKPP